MSRVPAAAIPVSPFTEIERTGSSSLRRRVTVQPGMCGPTQALVSWVGDWTWEAVSAVCGLEVSNARDMCGAPVYLAFYYYRIASGGGFDFKRLTFGDRLEIQSQIFDAGSMSVLTVHRLRLLTGAGDAAEPFDEREAFEHRRADCLYVENLNVWVSRGDPGSNVGLIRSAPVGFDRSRLPRVPDGHSPRGLCSQARSSQVFPDADRASWARSHPELVIDHAIDVTRDVNGVGLLYFASLFTIVEHAQLQLWQTQGRPARAFLQRTVLDARVCYLGNADLDATLRLRLHVTQHPHDPNEEKIDAAVSDITTGRVIAVTSFRQRSGIL